MWQARWGSVGLWGFMEESRVCVSISETSQTHPFHFPKLLISPLNKPEVTEKWHSAPLKLRSGPKADSGRVVIRFWHLLYPFFIKKQKILVYSLHIVCSPYWNVTATGRAVVLGTGKKQAWKQRITACWTIESDREQLGGWGSREGMGDVFKVKSFPFLNQKMTSLRLRGPICIPQ